MNYQMQQIKDKRNFLLYNCDWTQLPNSKVDKEAWESYRQELRDITSQEGFPFTIVWPTQP